MPAGLFARTAGALGLGYSKSKAITKGALLGTAGVAYGVGSLKEEVANRYTGYEGSFSSALKTVGIGTLVGGAAGVFAKNKISSGALTGAGALLGLSAGFSEGNVAGVGSFALGSLGAYHFLRGGRKLGTVGILGGASGFYSAALGDTGGQVVSSAAFGAGVGIAAFGGMSLLRRTGNLVGEGVVRGATLNKVSFKDLALKYSPSRQAREYRSLTRQISAASKAPGNAAMGNRTFPAYGQPGASMHNMAGSMTLNQKTARAARLQKKIAATNPVLIPSLAATAAGVFAERNRAAFGMEEELPPEYAAEMALADRSMPINMNTAGLPLGIHQNRQRRRL